MSSEPRKKSDAPIDLPAIPGYRIEGMLGRGASGVVYSAIQETIDRAVALKILRADLVRSARAVERFRREARTAARLAHPGIIAPIDLGQLPDGRWWYAMELVEGISLGERIQERGPLDEREALRMFIPLADALQHLHEVGVVHRDVKPANILIDPRERALLADLGLAFARDEPSLTGSGGVLGTPHYVSPEQARDSSKVDSRSDIWSLGATLYHAVTGKPPFNGSSVAEVFSSVLQDPLVDPRRYTPDLSASFVLVLRACLTRDINHRYQEPHNLRDDLQRLLERRSPEVSRDGLEPLESSGSWRRWAIMGSAVAILAAGAVWWKLGAADSVDETHVRVEDPLQPLRTLEISYDEGRILPVPMLERIAAWPRPGGAAPSGALGSGLQTLNIRAFRDLGESLRTLQQELEPDLEASLKNRNWEAAQYLLSRELPRKLLEGVGCASTASLPDVQDARSFIRWETRWEARVQAHLDERLRAVVRSGRSWVKDKVEPGVRAELVTLNYKEALSDSQRGITEALLAVKPEWNGLPEARAREALSEPLKKLLTGLEGEVHSHWKNLEKDLIAFLDSEAEVLSQRIESELLEGLDQELREGFAEELIDMGLSLDHVPTAWKQDVLDHHSKLGERLRREGRGKRVAVASNEWERDVASAQQLHAQRQYAKVGELWRDRLASPWRISVHSAMERELREANLLEDLLTRCSASLRLLNGKRQFLTFDGFSQEGTLIESPSALERGGVLLHGLRNERRKFLLRRGDNPEATILSPVDVVRLADMVEEQPGEHDMPHARALARALFLFHEGNLRGAKAALPRGEALEDPLTSDLERRILRALTQGEDRSHEQWIVILAALTRDVESGGQANRSAEEQIRGLLAEPGLELDIVPRLEKLLVESLANKGARTLESLYPDARILERGPEQASRRAIHLDWRFDAAPESWALGRFQTKPGTLFLPAFGGGVDGSGSWISDPLALSLAKPLEVSRPMGFTFHFRVSEGSSAAPVILTLGGYHLVFVTDGASSRFIGGNGDPQELLAILLEGDPSGFDGFAGFQPGVLHRLRVQITTMSTTRRGRIQSILIDDVELKSPSLVAQPASSSVIEFNSSGPLDLYRVEVKASENVGR
ncbi:MAG: serine/threonine protein kinase [bacterium]|nr:serine/threonine protein kinase [bacterium]